MSDIFQKYIDSIPKAAVFGCTLGTLIGVYVVYINPDSKIHYLISKTCQGIIMEILHPTTISYLGTSGISHAWE